MIRLISIAVSVFLSVVTIAAQTTQDQPTARSAPNSNWQVYELGQGNFTVLLPGKPNEAIQSSPGATNHLYTLNMKTGILIADYLVLTKEAENWSEGDTRKFYNGFWDGFAKELDKSLEQAKISVKLEGQRDITFAGKPGVEFTFLLGPYRGRFLINKVGYKAFAAGILATAELPVEEQEMFLTSFRIKPTVE